MVVAGNMTEPASAALWRLPPIDGPVRSVPHRAAGQRTDEREAWKKGYAEGREAGAASAREQQRAALAQLDVTVQSVGAVLDFLARPLADLDVQVVRELATLAGAIARQVVRRELKAQPDEIVAVIRETLVLLPIAAREVRVHLHPEDAKLVSARLPEVGAGRAWSIVEDPVLTRGGCRVTSETSAVDAQLEQRLGTAIAAVLGDERAVLEPGP